VITQKRITRGVVKGLSHQIKAIAEFLETHTENLKILIGLKMSIP